jgi:hypothetical protein
MLAASCATDQSLPDPRTRGDTRRPRDKRLGARSSQRGNEAKQDSARKGSERCKKQDARIDLCLIEKRNSVGRDGDEYVE